MNTQADLDAPQSDPSWAEANLPNGSNYDLTFNGGVLGPIAAAQYKTQMVSTNSTKKPACDRESGWAPQT